MAEGFDFVAEEFDADGEVVADGEDIEDATSAGELSWDSDGISGFVSEAQQFLSGFFGVDFGSGPKSEGVFENIDGMEGSF